MRSEKIRQAGRGKREEWNWREDDIKVRSGYVTNQHGAQTLEAERGPL